MGWTISLQRANNNSEQTIDTQGDGANKRQRIPKGQSRMNNSETLASFGDKRHRTKTNKTKHNIEN